MDVRFETKYGNKAGKHEWLTPPEVTKILGPFDLDPCFSEPRPWNTADVHYGESDDGLSKRWFGFVWCNPPYGEHTEKWLEKMAEHKECIGLIFARTETKMFRKYIWEKAKAVLFIYGRLTFYHIDGTKGNMSAGAPSCLVAWSDEGVERLKRYSNGKLVYLDN